MAGSGRADFLSAHSRCRAKFCPYAEKVLRQGPSAEAGVLIIDFFAIRFDD